MKKYILNSPTSGREAPHINYKNELNPQQMEVVMAGEGPILVIAGAGSGKTKTITYRVARLIESGISPSSILLLTFTNKAANDMLRRVASIIGYDIQQIWGGTFHHVGNIILRQHSELINYKNNYTILDREDAQNLIDDCTDNLGLRKHHQFPKGNVLAEVFSYSSNTQIDISKVVIDRFPIFSHLIEDIVRLSKNYSYRKRDINAMDFDDLLVNWHKLLLENTSILSTYSEKFRYILVDEYQDTNKIQANIIETLAGKNGNLTVVGDDSQSIYSFRGANFANIIDFTKQFPNAKMFKLEVNYRSTPEILSLANSSIKHNETQFHKTLRAVKRSGILPEFVTTVNINEQSQFIIQRISELHSEGIPLHEMAILYRSHYHSLELQMELTRAGIQYQVRSGLRFFEQAHIKDIISYLRIVTNPKDELAWKRVMLLYRGVGKKTAERVCRVLAESIEPLVTLKKALTEVSKSAKEGLKKLISTIDILSASYIQSSPQQAIESILENEYENYAVATFPNYNSRIDDIHQLSNFASQYESIATFLSDLALMSNVYDETTDLEIDDKDYLILSTVHQAKGLEWKVVFVIWLVDGKFPDSRAIKEYNSEEEERRLFYVAVTRAKDKLYLIYPILAQQSSILVNQRLSRFIRELDSDVYEDATTLTVDRL